MTTPPSFNLSGWLSEQLVQASPDLLRAMVKTFAEALMGAEAMRSAVPGTANGARSGSTPANGYRARPPHRQPSLTCAPLCRHLSCPRRPRARLSGQTPPSRGGPTLRGRMPSIASYPTPPPVAAPQPGMAGDTPGSPQPDAAEPVHPGLVSDLRERMAQLEAVLAPHHDSQNASRTPAWRRPTRGEVRWPVSVAMGVAIALQVALPNELNVVSRFLLPAVEAAILIVLLAINSRRIDRVSRPLRGMGLTLIAVASLANGYSAALLILGLVNGSQGSSAGPLLASGGAIYLTNILVFALWYWELDRGGPASRALALRTNPDFLFPQMANPHVTHPDWEPRFADYLYVSFTNATAFSPTDTMPLTRWAKMTMLLQSAIALVTIALVIARVVNILGT